MIDKMIRCKNIDNINKIESIRDWFYECPPKANLKHWRDGRSAKETAKHWLHTIPQPFKDILKAQQLKYKFCFPEYESDLTPIEMVEIMIYCYWLKIKI
ncbi:DUF6946 family protein [Flavobacterium algicola]|uniref:DUF6946 family protein n=1 Tax=Flavobacterium algicola TaxID=556529 RepID=UPI001EFEE106|nr:hypothetical protein [Flavobacterium algicola]MCG9791157.1 hypothetical protein [Flavobacterium algicola]